MQEVTGDKTEIYFNMFQHRKVIFIKTHTSQLEEKSLDCRSQRNIRDFVTRKTNKKSVDRYQKTYSLEEFVRFAMEEDEFQALLEWCTDIRLRRGNIKRKIFARNTGNSWRISMTIICQLECKKMRRR